MTEKNLTGYRTFIDEVILPDNDTIKPETSGDFREIIKASEAIGQDAEDYTDEAKKNDDYNKRDYFVGGRMNAAYYVDWDCKRETYRANVPADETLIEDKENGLYKEGNKINSIKLNRYTHAYFRNCGLKYKFPKYQKICDGWTIPYDHNGKEDAKCLVRNPKHRSSSHDQANFKLRDSKDISHNENSIRTCCGIYNNKGSPNFNQKMCREKRVSKEDCYTQWHEYCKDNIENKGFCRDFWKMHCRYKNNYGNDTLCRDKFWETFPIDYYDYCKRGEFEDKTCQDRLLNDLTGAGQVVLKPWCINKHFEPNICKKILVTEPRKDVLGADINISKTWLDEYCQGQNIQKEICGCWDEEGYQQVLNNVINDVCIKDNEDPNDQGIFLDENVCRAQIRNAFTKSCFYERCTKGRLEPDKPSDALLGAMVYHNFGDPICGDVSFLKCKNELDAKNLPLNKIIQECNFTLEGDDVISEAVLDAKEKIAMAAVKENRAKLLRWYGDIDTKRKGEDANTVIYLAIGFLVMVVILFFVFLFFKPKPDKKKQRKNRITKMIKYNLI